MNKGDLIANKYRIDQILGQGGMGVVVAATNLHLDHRVALKFLLPEFLRDSAVTERFIREARASARLRSEHVCHVYDVGIENGAPFIVMELLDGHDLASIVSGSGALPISVAADYVLQATIGLAEAHAHGIVHRDLKPANLFVTKRLDGTALVKILDFGIAKAPGDTQFQLTRTAAVMGSPGYMSPEQLRSTRDVDARSDIWALGIILYELVSGRPPFTAESITELTLRVAMDPLPPLPGMPREFERVIAQCLEKDPNRRFANVSQFAAALAPFGSARIAEAAVGTSSILSMSPAGPGSSAVISTLAPTTLRSSAGAISSSTIARSWLRRGMAALVVVAGIATVAVVKLGDPDVPVAARPHDEGTVTPLPAETPRPPAAEAAAAADPASLAIDADISATTADAAVATMAPAAPPPVTALPSRAAPSATAQRFSPPPRKRPVKPEQPLSTSQPVTPQEVAPQNDIGDSRE
ncbi:MAG TPA: serine/threonine-protein kinase [Kofleriaceae bacterium]|nr:serine/threonine-protein kinase [Kofleriaceae bacterium]